MIKNYLKIAFRALWRSKMHSIINILGLGLGIACCLLIVLFVRDEMTFDSFHEKADRIYRAYAKENWGENQEFTDITTPFPLGPALKDNFEEVEAMVRINPISSQLKVGNVTYTETVVVADSDFLTVFDFELLSGSKNDALKQPSNVLLSQSIARKYFGNTDPIGKVLTMQIGDTFEDFVVTAVLQDPPTNSSITYGLIISSENFKKFIPENVLTSAWFNISPETYVLLREGTDPAVLGEKFPSLFKSLLGDDYEKSKYFVGLQPITSIHLDTSFPQGLAPVSDPRYSYILSGIALLILLVACINFITLSVGRSLKRAKEVGIRKVVGAERRQLVFQFVGEAIIITLFGLIVGILLALINLSPFNDMSGKQLVLQPDLFTTMVIFILITIIGLIAGSYPAFILSGFKPISILKGNISSGDSKQRTRKLLVGVQLVLSIFLISSTLLMNKQLRFLQNKNLGFSREQLAVIPLTVDTQGRLRERVAAGFEKAAQFRVELTRVPGVISICTSTHDFGNGAWSNVGYTDDKGTYRTFFVNGVDDNYINAMGMEILQGRSFSSDNPADLTRSIIVNEAFVKAYGWTNPLGQRIPGKNFVEHEVIGVVKDFHFASLYSQVEPLVLAMNYSIPLSGIENFNVGNSPLPKLIVRLKSGEISNTLEALKSRWKQLANGAEFEFSFVDETLNAQYRSDQNLGRIVSSASMLAIVIGSLGLYGLASLAMRNRTKEISIRKVLGATQGSLLILLSREYAILVTGSLLVSIPFTWYLMEKWLASFQYRIGIDAGTFLLAGVIAMVLAFLTIGYQVVKTTWTQPADTLKYE